MVLRRPAVAKETDGVDRNWGRMAWMTLFYRVPRRKKEKAPSVPVT